MSAFRRKTALVALFAVSALVFASIGAANAQQSAETSRNYQLAEKQYQEQQRRSEEVQVQEQQRRSEEMQFQEQQRRNEEMQFQEQQRRSEEMRRALAMAQEMRFQPAMRMGSYFRSRSGGMAGRALAGAEELELTDAQEQAIRDTQRSHRREEIRRDADVEIAELELEEMMEADTLDLDTIESHMRQIANLQVDARMANLRLDRAVGDVLTPEQVDKLEEMSPERVIFETYQRQRNR